MSIHYKLRVTLLVPISLVLKKLHDISVMLYAQEMQGTDNHHVHFYLYTDVKEQTLRERMRTLKMNKGCYSLVQMDVSEEEKYPIEYIAYVMKCGEYTSQNIPEEILELCKNHDLKIKESITKKRETKQSAMQCIERLIPLDAYGALFEQQDNVLRYIINYYIENELPIRQHQVQTIHDTLMYKHCKDFRPVFRSRFARI